MNGVIKHKPKHTDERGSISAYQSSEGFKEILVVFRKKGAVSGNHYHTGKDPTRNPEIQYLISGKMKLTVRDRATVEKEDFIMESDTEARIAPNIVHRMEALEDTTFLEYHTEESNYSDMVKEEA